MVQVMELRAYQLGLCRPRRTGLAKSLALVGMAVQRQRVIGSRAPQGIVLEPMAHSHSAMKPTAAGRRWVKRVGDRRGGIRDEGAELIVIMGGTRRTSRPAGAARLRGLGAHCRP